MCNSQVRQKKATDITLITAVEDAESAEKVEEIVKKFRKPAVVFKLENDKIVEEVY